MGAIGCRAVSATPPAWLKSVHELPVTEWLLVVSRCCVTLLLTSGRVTVIVAFPYVVYDMSRDEMFILRIMGAETRALDCWAPIPNRTAAAEYIASRATLALAIFLHGFKWISARGRVAEREVAPQLYPNLRHAGLETGR